MTPNTNSLQSAADAFTAAEKTAITTTTAHPDGTADAPILT